MEFSRLIRVVSSDARFGCRNAERYLSWERLTGNLVLRRPLESAGERRSVVLSLTGALMKISSPAQEAAASASHGGAGS